MQAWSTRRLLVIIPALSVPFVLTAVIEEKSVVERTLLAVAGGAMVVLLLLCWVMGQLEFLSVYKHAILPRYLWVIVGSLVVVFLNLFALFYTASRWLFLKETGRKLAHVW